MAKVTWGEREDAGVSRVQAVVVVVVQGSQKGRDGGSREVGGGLEMEMSMAEAGEV